MSNPALNELPPLSTNDVIKLYSGKCLFITGATGFLGKALLEKLLRAVPGIGRIYLLSRPGKGHSAQERIEKEIIESRIFHPLIEKLERSSPGNGKRLFNLQAKKLVAISGDMTSPKLGIAPDLLQQLSENVDIVIHCAASINFDESLDQALQLNTLGALELHEMAESWKKVKSYVHISTAYVGANQHHGKEIPEAIHPMQFDPKEVIKQVKEHANGGFMTLEQIRLKVMGHFPNTYTLTKCMTEVLLKERFDKSTMPMAIVRPSIIGAAWSEPCPGWVDVVSAASAVFLAGGLGVVTVLPGNLRGVADIVPLDHVVNHIILAGAEVFNRPKLLHISHSCSSTINPVRWRVAARAVYEAFVAHTPSSKLTPGPVKFRMVSSPEMFALEWALKYSLPARAYGVAASLSGNEAAKSQAEQLKLLTDKAGYLVHLFTPFTSQEYFYGSDTMKRWISWEQTLGSDDPAGRVKNNPEDDINFSVDVLDVVWHQYFVNYTYGLNRFILHEDLVPISGTAVTHNDMKLTTDRLLQWDADHHKISFPGLFPDLSWAYTSYREPGYTNQGFFGRALGLTGWRESLAHEAKHVKRTTVRPTSKTLAMVLSSAQVKEAIKAHSAASKGKMSVADATKHAKKILSEIASTLEDVPPRRFPWALRKVWRKLFDGIRVHEAGLETVRKLIAEAEVPVVLVPTHRSYMDFLILSFIFFAYNLPVPYIAADQTFSNMGGGVSTLLRQSGAFFLSRDGKMKQSSLKQVIFAEYFARLLEDKQSIEFFIEGTRSRSGKCLEPKFGLLSLCVEPVLRGRVKDVAIIPIAIDYEKPLEVTLFADEMLGTGKHPETTRNLLKAATVFGKRFGHVSVQFEEPISIMEYLKSSPQLLQGTPTLASLCPPLGFRVVESLNRATVCMTTHLVATLLLVNPHGITLQQLIPAVDWLRAEVRSRGGVVVYVEGRHRQTIVEKALELLHPLVEERRGGTRVFQIASKTQEIRIQSVLALGYYRNKLIHLFAEEAMWTCALAASSRKDHVVSDGREPQRTARAQRTSKRSSLFGAASSMFLSLEPGDSLGQLKRAPDGRETMSQGDSQSGTGEVVISEPLDSLTQSVEFLSKTLRLEFVAMSVLDPSNETKDDGKSATWKALAQLDERGVLQVSPAEQTSGSDEHSATAGDPGLGASPWHTSPAERYNAGSDVVSLCPSPSAELLFGFLCNMVWPFLEGYGVAASSLLALEEGSVVSLNSLVEKASMLAETLLVDGLLKHFESCSVGVIQNAFVTFQKAGIVGFDTRRLPKKPNQPSRTERIVYLKAPYTDRKVLREFVGKLDHFRQPTPSSSGFALMPVTESPFLARL